MIYKHILKPILFRFDPEVVHDLFTDVGEWLGRRAAGRALVRLIYGYRGGAGHRHAASGQVGDISRQVDGITYRTPFMLSAGFDYNARLTQILPCIGLGGEEAGSVTARPCQGNPQPRLTRLPASRSILVNKGLRNDGVEAVIARLKSRGPTRGGDFVLGISIARTNDPASVPLQAGIDDYAYSFRRLNEEGVGDYYTINISCPNAFGGEAFTTPELLDRLLSVIMQIAAERACRQPIYIKMPINIPWEQFASLLRVIDVRGLHGVVIGNLNKDYDSLDVRSEAPASYRGGLSGKPCTHLSTDLIYKTREVYGDRFTIIGVGGVVSPETAMEKFAAGADLVQLVTGLIFEGPGLIRRLCRAVADKKAPVV